jgi:hypothetical protein
VPGPERLDTPQFSAALEELLRRRAGTPQRRHGRRVTAAAVLGALAATAAVALSLGGGRVEDAGATTGFRFPGGSTVTLDPALSRPELRELRRRFEAAGVELVIRTRPVKPRAAGRIFSVGYPSDARLDDAGRLIIDRRLDGPVVIVVGEPNDSARPGAGLTIYEAIPELCDLVDPRDAPATAEALRAAGYELRVMRVEFFDGGAQSERVADPPPGSLVISVMDERGRYTGVDPDTKRLTLEVGAGGHGHHGQTDGACAP